MPCKLKLKDLESYLQDIDGFSNPKIQLEQYATQPHIAARMLFTIQSCYDDINGKLVCDLGCGCAMLSIGCSMLGATACVGFDIDDSALEIGRKNCDELDMKNIDFVQCDVTNDIVTKHKFDVVVMNPPFGTKRNAGIDIKFLERAFELTCGPVYSLHKTSTRDYISKKVLKSFNAKGEVLAELRFDLPASYRFHKKDSLDVQVDLWRFIKK